MSPYGYRLLVTLGLFISACGSDDAPIDAPDVETSLVEEVAVPSDSPEADAESADDTDVVTADTASADAVDVAAIDATNEEETTPTPVELTVHYHRADGDYEGWTLQAEPPASEDGFGAVYVVAALLDEGPIPIQLTGPTDSEPEAPVWVNPAMTDGVWLFHGGDLPLFEPPPAVPGPDQVAVYYVRPDGEYTGWGLHLWGDVSAPTEWNVAAVPGGVHPVLGAWWLVDLVAGGDRVNLIVHKGDEKDPGPDMGFDLSADGDMVWLMSGETTIVPYPSAPPEFGIDGARAHWLAPGVIAWNPAEQATSFELRWAPDGGIAAVGQAIQGGTVVPLAKDAVGLSAALQTQWPHLADRATFSLADTNKETLEPILKSELVVVARDAAGTAVEATRVQIPGVLDALYASDAPLGPRVVDGTPHISVWAPTARVVKLVRFSATLEEVETHSMTRDDDGVWSITGTPDWVGQYFQYDVEVFHPASGQVETLRVTDPYSLGLSENSLHTWIVDLDNPALKPAGWDGLAKPPLASPSDVTVYESHVRDLSVFDETVPAAHRGRFKAFTHPSSDFMVHLKLLADAGLTHLHLLPFFDIATINEDSTQRVEITDGFDRLCNLSDAVPADLCALHGTTPIVDVLAGLDPTTGDAQAIVGYLRTLDGFNWGYDPFHYTVPEGSYATATDGPTRILELREAVKGIADLGLRVVMDVVYNHTNAAGLSPKSVLDKIVPGYYHRQHVDTGEVEQSTCCPNTATEHRMMERLMVDSLVVWARDYKIDSFRFDLMGHHMVSNMEKVRDTLGALTLESDGVDGSAIYLYGEGWDFGEVANNARGVNASQLNMSGTGIGTFNDRLRDAVRGGGPFDTGEALETNVGFCNGPSADLAAMDRIRVGMAGNLKSFNLVDESGDTKTGELVDFGGTSTGYTDSPSEVVNYASKHDNHTLFDINAYKAAAGTSPADRARMQVVALATVALGQGVPFFHMGSELLRSKSMERDSFDSGDWYNRVDYTFQTNNWNVGLPRADKDEVNWPVIKVKLADTTIAPAASHISATRDAFLDLLRIRYSTVLLRLREAGDINLRMHFHNTGADQTPGLLAFSVSDGPCAGSDLDPAHDAVVVIINATGEAQSVFIEGANGFALHPVHLAGSDATVKLATFATGTFTVPALTAATFVAAQSGAPKDAVGCNPL